MNDELAEKIYNALSTQRFADWYNEGGRFDEHLQDMERGPSREAILADIKRLFRIE